MDIAAKYGVPREHVSCPGCGQIYGHHNTKICANCEECSKCCQCEKPKYKKVNEIIHKLLNKI